MLFSPSQKDDLPQVSLTSVSHKIIAAKIPGVGLLHTFWVLLSLCSSSFPEVACSSCVTLSRFCSRLCCRPFLPAATPSFVSSLPSCTFPLGSQSEEASARWLSLWRAWVAACPRHLDRIPFNRGLPNGKAKGCCTLWGPAS